MIALIIERQIGGKKPCPTKKKKTPKRTLVPSAPSIPSKYDRTREILFEKQDTAFLCSTRRFDENRNGNPGPGQYHKASSYVKDTSKCGSTSTRGYTALISLDPRFSDLKELKSQGLPGPATYTPSISMMKPSPVKINFAKHNTSGDKRKLESNVSPGPGHYCFGDKEVSPSNLGAASFKFTARKESDMLLQQDTTVAVGRYDVAKSLDYIEKLGKEPRKGKEFPDHIFSSTASRLAPIVFSQTPAPGYYDSEPYLSSEISSEMFRPSSVFRNGLDRFGNSNNVRVYRDIIPGPDTYYSQDISKSHAGGAVASFSSTSERFEEGSKNEIKPGPQNYNPQHVPRKSFHLNRHCQWI